MKSILKYWILIVMGLLYTGVYGQFHEINVPKITSLEEAKAYASRYKEVSFGLVNSELDFFLFDDVDTADLKASIGKTNTVYRRKTKFLKDTSVIMVNAHVIEFNFDLISVDSATTLVYEIIKQYNLGVTYWYLMKDFESEAVQFNGGATSIDLLNKRYGTTLEDRKKDEIFKWNYSDRKEFPCIIIIVEEAHPVPAFYSISYNIAG